LTSPALPRLAAARVSGPDAADFLHAHLSADILALPDGGASFACYCSPRGQVYGLLLVCRCGEAFHLIADAGLLPGMLQRLRLFVLRSKVELEMTGDFSVSVGVDILPEDDSTLDCQPSGLDLCYRLAPLGTASPLSPAAAKELELRRGIVWLDPGTTERFIPQMLGMDLIGAVNFKKGCYPGQEIIARARYLGQVKRKPALLRVSRAPGLDPGASVRLLDGEEWLPGTVIDSVRLEGSSDASETLVFVVSAAPSQSVTSLEYAGSSYRCATI
jgi:folate-binding protein YgfZ